MGEQRGAEVPHTHTRRGSEVWMETDDIIVSGQSWCHRSQAALIHPAKTPFMNAPRRCPSNVQLKTYLRRHATYLCLLEIIHIREIIVIVRIELGVLHSISLPIRN